MGLIPVMKHEAKQMWVRFSNGRGRPRVLHYLKIDNFETNSCDTLGFMEKTDGRLRLTVLPPNTLQILSEALMFFRGPMKMRPYSKRMAGKYVLSMQSLHEKVA